MKSKDPKTKKKRPRRTATSAAAPSIILTMRKLAGEFLQRAVVFFAAILMRVVYGLVLGLPSFFLFDSWWLDFLIFGIVGMVACSMSIHPPGMRWTQSLLLFGVTVWLVAERLAGRPFLPPVDGAEETLLPMVEKSPGGDVRLCRRSGP